MEAEERNRLMQAGREAFNRGEFYEGHEFWGGVWEVFVDPDRRWIQGLIQIATGLHKLQRERPDLCRTLLRKALEKIVDAPESLDQLDLGTVRQQSKELLEALEQGQKPRAESIRIWQKTASGS